MKRTGTARDLVFNPSELATAYVAWAKRNASDPGIPFGIPAIDKLVIPMRAGELIAIIARPGHGKSSLMAYLARQTANRFKAAKEDKRVVVYVTWEQSAEELSVFFLANDRHSISDVAWGKANLDEILRMAVKGVTTPIWVIGHGIGRAGRRAPRMTIDVVLNAIGSMEEDFGVKPGLILADYIQLVPVANVRDRMSQVTEVPHLLKELALQIGVPIVAGVQARRDVDDRKLKIPEQRDAQWACVAGDTELINAQTGQKLTASVLWRMFDIGAIARFPVHGIGAHKHRLELDWIEGAKRNPPEQLYSLRCGNAGNIRANAKHKLLTTSGFKTMSELQVGEWVALAKRLAIDPGRSEVSPGRAYVLGLLLGDGTVTQTLTLTNTDRDILVSFREAVECEWPDHTTKECKQTAWEVYDSTIRRRDGRVFPHGNAALNWVRGIGVFGQTANSKRVPRLLMGDAAVSALLSGLFSTDGGISFRNNRPQITFSSCSRGLVKDVHVLLLRLGIASTIRRQRPRDKCHQALWCLLVATTDFKLFMGQVKIIGKKGERLAAFAEEHPVQFGRSLGDLLPPAWNMEAIRVLKEQHLRTRFNNVKGRAVTRGRMLRIANATGDAGLLDYALCDLRWQRVTSIEPDGIEHTFDFRVPGRETFVANGFVVHNSSVEQTCDKVFALWRPALTEDPDEIDSVELLGKRIPINEKLLVIRMLKQRGEQGRATWAMYFDPAYLELAELETLADRLAGRG